MPEKKGKRQKKYNCDYPEYHFFLKKHDDERKVVFKTDAQGNNKVPELIQFSFTLCPKKDPKTGKISQEDSFCVFVAEEEKLGTALYERVVEHLDKKLKNPKNKLFTPEDHLRNMNPVAAQFNDKIQGLEEKLSEKDKKIKALEEKLGIKK